MARLTNHLLAEEADQLRYDRSRARFARSGWSDYLIAHGDEAPTARQAFDQLRWGGQVAFLDAQHRRVSDLARSFNRKQGFILEEAPTRIDMPGFSLRYPWIRQRMYYFVARKIELTHPSEVTDRYSYRVRLDRGRETSEGYNVLKRVPDRDDVIRRLMARFPDADETRLHKGAHKLVDHVFPVLLTREAAFLKILQERLPDEYRGRFPHIVGLEKDDDGLVRKMHLNWMRLGGETLSQLEFARQAAELLHVLHEKVGIMHLDLRLDNVVVTEGGVGFVDFGSAVRVGEDFKQSPMLDTLFSEMLSTCQVQRTLGKMKSLGRITSPIIAESHQRAEKAVDLFYLSLQVNKPHSNPDFKGLIEWDRESEEARYLERLTEITLRPHDPASPPIRNAWDLLRGLAEIDDLLAEKRFGAAPRRTLVCA